MDLEKMIVRELKHVLNNSKLKADDVQQWSSDEADVKKNLRADKENYVTCSVLDMTWHCAVLKTADKRKQVPASA